MSTTTPTPCYGHEELFEAADGEAWAVREAKAICATCPAGEEEGVMKSYGTAVYAGGGWGGSHVPLPTTPRPNRQRAERPSPIVLQPLTKAEERALERRSEKRAPKHHPGGNSNNPVGQEEARSYLAAYTAGQTIKAIARDHHRGAPTVRAHLVRQGVTIRPPHNVTTARIADTERAEMIAKYRSGMSLKAVAAAHGRVHGTVLKILRDAGVPRRPEGGRTKVFTPKQQTHIVATYERACGRSARPSDAATAS